MRHADERHAGEMSALREKSELQEKHHTEALHAAEEKFDSAKAKP